MLDICMHFFYNSIIRTVLQLIIDISYAGGGGGFDFKNMAVKGNHFCFWFDVV